MRRLAGPGALCACSALLLAAAPQFDEGRALSLVGAALVVAAAVWLRFGAPPGNALPAQVLLGSGCAAGLARHLFLNPTAYADPRAFVGGFRWIAASALVFLSAYLCLHLRASLVRARFILLLISFAVLAIAVLRASPPASQGELVGDPRVLSLAAMLGAAWALSRALPGVTGELAALFVLFQPCALSVLEQGGSAPLLLFALFLALLFAQRPSPRLPRWIALGLALGALAASRPWLTQGRHPPAPFVAGAVVLAVTLRRRMSAPQALPAAGAACAVFVLLNGQAFCNYHWFVAGLVGAGAAAQSETA